MSARKARAGQKAHERGARLRAAINDRRSTGHPVFTMDQYEAAELLIKDRFGLELLEWVPVGGGRAFIVVEGSPDVLFSRGIINQNEAPVPPARLYWDSDLTVRCSRGRQLTVQINTWCAHRDWSTHPLSQFIYLTAPKMVEIPKRAKKHLRLVWVNPAMVAT